MFQNSQQVGDVLRLHKVLEAGSQLLFVVIDQRLEFVLALVGLEYYLILILHLGLNLEVVFQFLLGVLFHNDEVIFQGCLSRLLGLLDFELFWSYFLLLRVLLFILFLILFLVFFLVLLVVFLILFVVLLIGRFGFGHLRLLDIFLLQEALFEGDDTVLVVLDLEDHVELVLLGILRRGLEVSNILAETLNNGIVGQQQFDPFFLRKFDCLGNGKRTSSWEYQVRLFFYVGLFVVGQWWSTRLQEVPMEFDWIQVEFFKTVFCYLE